MNLKFLQIELVLHIHSDQINLYGGTHGIRDAGLLDSAVNQPQSTFRVEYLHKDIFSMAAAYGFHLSQNQPFMDGNKRTAGMCMMTFLVINGYEPTATPTEYYEAMIKVSEGRMKKSALTKWIKAHCRKIKGP